MYSRLHAFFERPAPFSVVTTRTLWTDPHIAARMLEYHLDPETDWASRRPRTIAAIVAWFDVAFALKGKAVCDLGCGPGLYAAEMARRGARVTGIDFSPSSIAHARGVAEGEDLSARFSVADYLADDLPTGQDLVVLIYGDYCALPPQDRRRLCARVRESLAPGGAFVFDVFSLGRFAALREEVEFGRRLMDGFWAPGDYFGFRRTLLYSEEKVGLDRYLVVAPGRSFEIFNWMQYFDPEGAVAEARAFGFSRVETADIATGGPWVPGPTPFAVIARP